MFLDIKPVRNADYNCFDGIVASVAKYWNLDYIIMFLSVWGFRFESGKGKNTTSMGERLDHGGKNNLIELLREYHGLNIECYYNSENSKILERIRAELSEGKPTAIGTDAFLCPWNPAYKKYHIPHFYLVIGIDEKERELMCIDPFCTSNIERVPFDGFSSTVESYLVFMPENKKTREFDWRTSLSETVVFAMENDEAFDAMRRFANEIQSLEDLSKESDGCADLYRTLLLLRIKQLSLDRYKFRELLAYLSEKYGVKEMADYAENMEHAAKMWDNVVMLMAKEILKSRKSTGIKRIADMVFEAADYEEKLALGILKLCRNEDT